MASAGTINSSTFSMAPAKKPEFGPSVKYSIHPDESTMFTGGRVAFKIAVHTFQKAAHFFHRLHGNNLNPAAQRKDLQLLAGFELQEIPHRPRDDHLKFRR